MSWAEFQIRLFAFNRAEEKELLKIRRLAWTSFIAPHQDPKKLRGLRENKWWVIGQKQNIRVSEEHKERFIVKYKEYLAKTTHARA